MSGWNFLKTFSKESYMEKFRPNNYSLAKLYVTENRALKWQTLGNLNLGKYFQFNLYIITRIAEVAHVVKAQEKHRF